MVPVSDAKVKEVEEDRRSAAGGSNRWRRGVKERALSKCREALLGGNLWGVLLPLQALALALSQAKSPSNVLTKSGGAGEVTDLLSEVLDAADGASGADQDVSRCTPSNISIPWCGGTLMALISASSGAVQGCKPPAFPQTAKPNTILLPTSPSLSLSLGRALTSLPYHLTSRRHRQAHQEGVHHRGRALRRWHLHVEAP